MINDSPAHNVHTKYPMLPVRNDTLRFVDIHPWKQSNINIEPPIMIAIKLNDREAFQFLSTFKSFGYNTQLSNDMSIVPSLLVSTKLHDL